MERDPRWENMWVSIKPASLSRIIEIRFEIYKSKAFDGFPIVWTSQLIHENELTAFKFNFFGFILDEMVTVTDDYLDAFYQEQESFKS